MQKPKFDKQQSGFNLLNFEITPINKNQDAFAKDFREDFSFTGRSKEDPFQNNQAFEDYMFNSLQQKGDQTNVFKNGSPMTRSQRAKIVEQARQQMSRSPEKFQVDLSKHSHCPMCRQKLPKSPTRGGESPIKTPRTRRNAAANGNLTKRSKESEESEYRIEKHMKKVVEEDPNANKRRKSKHQVKMLEAELEANPHWTNEDMVKIAKKTGLSKSQVYKWNWDQKKKLNILPSKVYVVQLPSDMIDPKSGQILLKSADGLKKLQTLNLETIIQKPKGK